jgi:hypothetical protein
MKVEEIAKSLGLHVEVAGRVNRFLQFRPWQAMERGSLHDARVSPIGVRPLHVLPRCVLHKDGAHHHLERRLAEPPVLWSEYAQEKPANIRRGTNHGNVGC